MPDIASLEAQAVAALEARQEALRWLNASHPPGDPEYLAGLRALPAARARAGRLTVCAIVPSEHTRRQVRFQFRVGGRMVTRAVAVAALAGVPADA